MPQYLFGYDISEGQDISVLMIGLRTDKVLTISKVITGEEAVRLAAQLGPDPFITKEEYSRLMKGEDYGNS